MNTEVERIYLEIVSARDIISKHGTASDIIAFEAMAAKYVLLSAASYFEKTVCDAILKYAESAGTSPAILSFIDGQALKRKYHTLFDWECSNINKFIRLFGNDFFKFMEPKLAEDGVRNAIQEFLFLGQTRNALVHDNFAEYKLDVTADDIKAKFDSACPLMNILTDSFAEFDRIPK